MTILIYGLGLTGFANAKYLNAKGESILLWDDSEEARQKAEKEGYPIADMNTLDWSQITAILKAPGVPWDTPHLQTARKKKINFISDIDLFYKANSKATYIGITGTNGKSTTTGLTHHVLQTANLKTHVGGNYEDTPTLSLPMEKDAFYVLELSSFQLETMNEIQFSATALLNVTPDHLDRYDTLQDYLKIKAHLFDLTKEKSPQVINTDQPELANLAKILPHAVTLSTEKEADIHINRANQLIDGERVIADLNCYKDNLPGKHNAQNICAVWGLTRAYVTENAFRQALQTYKPLAHRSEFVAEINGVTYINDSKGTNAEATIPALEAYKNIWWIVGGKEKAEGIAPCVNLIKSGHLQNVEHALVIGKTTEKITDQLKDLLPTTPCHTLQEAVKQAKQNAPAGTTVLFSPATASFDQFQSYTHRGEVFKKLVIS